jgi:hypothetical protein
VESASSRSRWRSCAATWRSGGAAAGAAVLFRLADLWLPLGAGLLLQASDLPPVQRAGERALGWRQPHHQPPSARPARHPRPSALFVSLALSCRTENVAVLGAVSLAALAAAPALARATASRSRHSRLLAGSSLFFGTRICVRWAASMRTRCCSSSSGRLTHAGRALGSKPHAAVRPRAHAMRQPTTLKPYASVLVIAMPANPLHWGSATYLALMLACLLLRFIIADNAPRCPSAARSTLRLPSSAALFPRARSCPRRLAVAFAHARTDRGCRKAAHLFHKLWLRGRSCAPTGAITLRIGGLYLAALAVSGSRHCLARDLPS